ncbi:HRDC domain-containing protein, partial [Kitasatospora sp. MBT63]
VVFTDATLMAIAEDVPAGERELAMISGVGAMKLDKYGAAVLSLCAGEDPWEDSAEQPAGEPVEEPGPEPDGETDEPA